MPFDPYENPTRKPPVGKYIWSPKEPPASGGNYGVGWTTLDFVRGIFRNDYFISDSEKTLTVTFSPASEESLKPYSPINNSFRKLQTPNKNVETTKDPFKFANKNFEYLIEFPPNNKVASITIKYTCSVDIYDSSLLGFMESSNVASKVEDIRKVKDFRDKPQTTIMDVDWSKYTFINIKAYKKGDTEETVKTWPEDKSEIKTTGYYTADYDSSSSIRDVNVIFGKTNIESEFQIIEKIKIENSSNIKVKFNIHNIMLFNYGKKNLRYKNVPCSLFSYVIPLFIKIPVAATINNFYHPAVQPSFSLKLFSPDEKTNSHGFAHAINIRFIIAWF